MWTRRRGERKANLFHRPVGFKRLVVLCLVGVREQPETQKAAQKQQTLPIKMV